MGSSVTNATLHVTSQLPTFSLAVERWRTTEKIYFWFW